MIKKVKIKDLSVGVYVCDFNCNDSKGNIYIDEGFITDSSIIKILDSWGIEEVYIDTDVGKDITEKRGHSYPASPGSLPPKRTEKYTPPEYVTPTYIEMRTARKIVENTAAFIETTIEDVKRGKMVRLDDSYSLASSMHESIKRNRDALLLLTRIRQKDEYTLYHSIRVSSLVLGMCSFYRLPEQQTLDLGVGALFHDIGKTFIEDSILHKPGRLSDAEFEQMKLHAGYSAKLLKKVNGLPKEAYEIALHHHERIDGKGYPFGLKDSEISFGVQITSISDIFDAVTSNRCYRKGLGTVDGLKILYEMCGTHLQKDLTHDFIRNIGVYPVGSCVKIEQDLLGVVVRSTDNIERPIVRILYDFKKKKSVDNLTVNLDMENRDVVSYVDPIKYKLTPERILNIVNAH